MKKFLVLLTAFAFCLAQDDDNKTMEVPQRPAKKSKQDNDDDRDYYYPARFTISGFYLFEDKKPPKKNKSSFFGEADVFIPLLQNSKFIFFASLRGLDFEGKKIEGNFGAGIRMILGNYDWIFGAYTFYDRKRSSNANLFNQITAGLEFKTRRLTLDVNGYFPFGDTSQRADLFDVAKLQTAIAPFQNIIFKRGMEVALWGFDGEIGYNVWQGLSFFLGGFYFHRNNADTVTGPFARVNWRFNLNSTNSILFDQIHLELGSSYDDVRDWRFYAGIKLSWMIGGKPEQKPRGLARRMTEYVRRDYDVITTGNNTQPLRIYEENGQAVKVRFANTEAELTTPAQVVAVEGAITISGDLITNNGQTFTGGDYIFDEDVKIHLSDGGSFENFNVIVAEGNTIRDLTFKNTNLNNDGTSHVGTLTVDHVTFNSGMTVVVADSGDNSNLYVNNCTFNNQGRVIVRKTSNDTTLGSVTVKQFNDNTFNNTPTVSDFPAVTIETLAINANAKEKIHVEEAKRNTFAINPGAQTGVRGFLFANVADSGFTNVEQTISVGVLEENRVTVGGTAGNHFPMQAINGIQTNVTTATQTIQFTSLSSNTFEVAASNNNKNLHLINSQTNTASGTQTIDITELAFNEVIMGAGTGNSGIAIENTTNNTTNTTIRVGSQDEGGFFLNQMVLGVGSTSGIAFTNDAQNGQIQVKVNNFGQELSPSNFNANVQKTGSNVNGIAITP
ncbi:MAG: hypothetical protein K940chlam8_00249 [Chlamydiae bacterium]|nr:hypothetical protein [Chlamydiota bacterium]